MTAQMTCSIAGCDRRPIGRGWCRKHYLRWYKHGDPLCSKSNREVRESCAVEGCEKPLHGSTWCQMHYVRVKIHGDPLYERPRTVNPPKAPRPTFMQRFADRVCEGEPDACWPWAGARDTYGYGYIWSNGGQVKAHRLALTLATGESGEDLWCLHSCDNPTCVNPAHLRWGTPADNSADMASRGRGRKDSSHYAS